MRFLVTGCSGSGRIEAALTAVQRDENHRPRDVARRNGYRLASGQRSAASTAA
jgi:hypothetical protein